MREGLSWSSIAHQIGDMFDDDEMGPALVELDDGSVVRLIGMNKRDGQWRLLADSDSRKNKP